MGLRLAFFHEDSSHDSTTTKLKLSADETNFSDKIKRIVHGQITSKIRIMNHLLQQLLQCWDSKKVLL